MSGENAGCLGGRDFGGREGVLGGAILGGVGYLHIGVCMGTF